MDQDTAYTRNPVLYKNDNNVRYFILIKVYRLAQLWKPHHDALVSGLFIMNVLECILSHPLPSGKINDAPVMFGRHINILNIAHFIKKMTYTEEMTSGAGLCLLRGKWSQVKSSNVHRALCQNTYPVSITELSSYDLVSAIINLSIVITCSF